MPDTSSAMRAALDADAAAREVAEMAEQLRGTGALGASAALAALARDRKARADRVWAMERQALHTRAMAGRAVSFTTR